MDRLKKAALLTDLIARLRERGSWCGETHIQKATFFLQDLMGVPLGFDFILYKHGPFSSDLTSELTSLRADELVELEPQWPPYGPRIALTERSDYIHGIYSKTLAKYSNHIDFVADKLGNKAVTELERLATALYVTRRGDIGASAADRAEELTRLKPHISSDSSQAAIEEVDGIIKDARVLTH